MPLWCAALLLLIFAVSLGVSLRLYRRGSDGLIGKKIFLRIGIASAIACAVAVLYAVGALLFICSVD